MNVASIDQAYVFSWTVGIAFWELKKALAKINESSRGLQFCRSSSVSLCCLALSKEVCMMCEILNIAVNLKEGVDYFTCSESEGSTPSDYIVPMVIENTYTQDCQGQYTENGSRTTVDNEELKHVKNVPSMSMGKSIWKPLPKNLQPCSMYSPQSVKNYILMNQAPRRRRENTTKVRSHLLALGWQIEHSPYRGYERFRYISPDEEVYFSLQKVCEQLVKQGKQNCSDSISSGSQVVQAQIPLEGDTGLNKGVETGCWDSGQHSSIVVEKRCTTQIVMDVDSRRLGLCKRKLEFNDRNAAVKKVNLEDPFQQNGSMWGSCMNPASVKMPSDGQMKKCVDGLYINTSSKRISSTILSYLIDNCMISIGDKAYYNNEKENIPTKEGSIRREGILCSCCGNVYSISKFEVHAGSNYRPAANIVLENGKSLLELQRLAKQVTRMKGSGQYPTKQHIDDNKKDEGLTGFLHKHMCNYVPQQAIPPLEDFNKVNGFTTHPLHQGSQPLVGSDDLTGNSCQQVKNKLPQPEAQQRNDDNVFTAFKVNPHEASENNIICDEGNGMCHICRHDGNELVACKGGCLSMFHFSCIGLKLLGKSNPTGVDGLSWTVLKSNKNYDNDPSKSQADTKNERKLLDARAVLRECFKRIILPGSKTDLITDIVFSKEYDVIIVLSTLSRFLYHDTSHREETNISGNFQTRILPDSNDHFTEGSVLTSFKRGGGAVVVACCSKAATYMDSFIRFCRNLQF
ncbi:hypothetical protein ACLOJK_003459 [Asimina triloba]